MKAALEKIKSDDYSIWSWMSFICVCSCLIKQQHFNQKCVPSQGQVRSWHDFTFFNINMFFFFFTWHVWDTKWYKLLMVELLNSKHTLLFMKALRHWMSLCWFFLSMFSCLRKRKSVSKKKKRVNEQPISTEKRRFLKTTLEIPA